MKLVCPHCAKVVDVDDSRAGQTTSCPQCQGPFTVPLTPPPLPGVGTMNPLPPPPPPPPTPDPLSKTTDWRASGSSVVPPIPTSTAQPSSRPSWAPNLQDINIPPWLREGWTLIVLALLFLLQFFPWVGVYVGDATLVQQSGASIGFGTASVSDKAPMTVLTQDLGGASLLVIYFLATLVGFILCILMLVARFVPATSLSQVKPTIDRIFAYKNMIVLILLGLTGLILLLYLVAPFPLENAAQMPDKAAKVMHEGLKLKADFGDMNIKSADMVWLQWLHRRCWFTFAFLVNFIAALVVVYYWLQDRGYTRNWPRFSVQRPVRA